MNYVEFPCMAECPHCSHEQEEHVEFDMSAGDRSGVGSGPREAECCECFKKFWFKSYLRFDVELEAVFKKKPKEKR